MRPGPPARWPALLPALALAVCLPACRTTAPATSPSTSGTLGTLGSLTKEFPGASASVSAVRDSVYLAVDRRGAPPKGYGLYSVLLARTADRNTLQLLAELFKSTPGAADAALPRENLNLITLPAKNAAEAARLLTAARNQPAETAGAFMQKHYDHGQAALLMASVCQPARGAAAMKACGSQAPEGPLLVSTLRPLDGSVVPEQPLLIVNLSTTPPEALREVLAAYRRQIQRADFADRAELDGWRLLALNHVLDAARLLPGISKAYAAGR